MPSPISIAIIGLGYVGLPLAVEFARKYPVTGFDIKLSRLNELKKGNDTTLEVSKAELNAVLSKAPAETGLYITSDPDDLAVANYYIVTVPTPTDKNHRPDLTPLIKASETIGQVLKPGDIVIYESTVYPGATEDDCVPILEQFSGLTYCTSALTSENSALSIRSALSTSHPLSTQHSPLSTFFVAIPPNASTPGTRSTPLQK